MSHMLGDDFTLASICSSEDIEGAHPWFLQSPVSPVSHSTVSLCVECVGSVNHSPKQSLEVPPHSVPSSPSNPPKAGPVALGLPSPVRLMEAGRGQRAALTPQRKGPCPGGSSFGVGAQ